MKKRHVIKAERETILLTNEASDAWEIYTFNTDLKKRLKLFATRHPDLCKLQSENTELGCVTYTIQKSRVSIHLIQPYSEERKRTASECAKKNMRGLTSTKVLPDRRDTG